MKLLAKQSKLSLAVLWFSITWVGELASLTPGEKYNFKGKDGQDFKGATLIREEEDAWIVKLYFADQEVRILKKDVAGQPTPFDQNPPQATLDPPPGQSLNAVTSFRVKFNEPVKGAQVLGAYALSGGGRNSLQPARVKRITEQEYVLELSGKAGTGQLVLKLQGIKDASGNAVSPNSFEYSIDSVMPSVQSNPPAKSSRKNFEQLEVIFSEPMRGAGTQANYRLQGPAAAGLSIDEVSTDNDGRRATIELNGQGGEGELVLVLRNIHDEAGNAPAPDRLTYQIDRSAPNWKIFPSCGSSLRELQSLEVVMDEAISEPRNTSGYELSGAGAGSLSITDIQSSDGQNLKLRFSGEPALGELKLTLPSFADRAGNTAAPGECKFNMVRAAVGTVSVSPAPGEGKSFYKFPGQHVAFSGSYAFVAGQYAEYYPNGLIFSLRAEYDLRWPLQLSRVFKDNPLSPALIVDIGYHMYTGDGRTMSGPVPALGPVWYVPFYPSKGGRIALSSPVGMTLLTIEGKTFSGALRAFFLAPGLEYQYFIDKIFLGLGFRQNIVLDSEGSLFSKSISLSAGYAF